MLQAHWTGSALLQDVPIFARVTVTRSHMIRVQSRFLHADQYTKDQQQWEKLVEGVVNAGVVISRYFVRYSNMLSSQRFSFRLSVFRTRASLTSEEFLCTSSSSLFSKKSSLMQEALFGLDWFEQLDISADLKKEGFLSSWLSFGVVSRSATLLRTLTRMLVR